MFFSTMNFGVESARSPKTKHHTVKMKLIGPVRSVEFFEVARECLEHKVELIKNNKDTRVRVLHVDPFLRRVSPLVLPRSLIKVVHVASGFEDFSFHTTWQGTGTVFDACWPGEGHTHMRTTPLCEDLTNGNYIGCMHLPDDDGAQGTAPKEPGCLINGVFTPGHAMLVRGVEMVALGRSLDVHEDLREEDMRVEGVDLLATIEWLTVAQVKDIRRERGAWTRAAHASVAGLSSSGTSVIIDDTGVFSTKVDATATCWNCQKKRCAVRKCDRCKAAYYCSKECQRSHWSAHKGGCASLSPASAAAPAASVAPAASAPASAAPSPSPAVHSCGNCDAKRASYMRCSRCKAAWYCDAACQSSHWGAHRDACMAHS